MNKKTIYPLRAGTKDVVGSASEQAANRIDSDSEQKLQMYTKIVYHVCCWGEDLVPDQIALLMDRHFLAIRPRVSELVGCGVLQKAQIRMASTRGLGAHVILPTKELNDFIEAHAPSDLDDIKRLMRAYIVHRREVLAREQLLAAIDGGALV